MLVSLALRDRGYSESNSNGGYDDKPRDNSPGSEEREGSLAGAAMGAAAGGVSGAKAGLVVGTVLGGPVGALIGTYFGGWFGAALGGALGYESPGGAAMSLLGATGDIKLPDTET